MILSMTGYGRAAAKAAGQQVNVEVRTLNSKTFELSLRIPSALKSYEYPLRQLITDHIQRGKADVLITLEGSETGQGIINTRLLDNYLRQLKQISRRHQLSDQHLLQAALSIPGVMGAMQTEMAEEGWQACRKAVLKALEDLSNYRKKEGRSLEADLMKRINLLKQLMKKIQQSDPQRKNAIKNKLKKLVSQSKAEGNHNRLEQELIFYFEKMDITEELVRLQSHFGFFTDTVASKEPSGKKLGFILQEMNREVNTLGAKASDAGIQKMVVEMKDELEKIKEQLANVL